MLGRRICGRAIPSNQRQFQIPQILSKRRQGFGGGIEAGGLSTTSGFCAQKHADVAGGDSPPNLEASVGLLRDTTLTLPMTASPHSTSTAYQALFRWLLLDPVAGLCNGNDPDWRRDICGTEESCVGVVVGEILIDAPERVLG
jgi:hypothetical protein